MKHFAYTLAIAGMVGAMGTFAAAQSDTDVDAATTTCADFLAMSAADQRSALDSLNAADASATTDTTAEGADAGADVSANTDAATSMTDETASEAADADTSTDTAADTSPDTDAATADVDADADEAAGASEDPEVQAVIAACEGNEDALVADQLTSR